MTAGKLAKILLKCNPRSKVCVHRETFRHSLDEVVIFDVDGAVEELVLQCSDDGGIGVNKDGSEKYKRCVVLRGDYPENPCAEIPTPGLCPDVIDGEKSGRVLYKEMVGEDRLRLELEVECIVIELGERLRGVLAGDESRAFSSRVQADRIVKLVSDSLCGVRKPGKSKPWEAFGVGKSV